MRAEEGEPGNEASPTQRRCDSTARTLMNLLTFGAHAREGYGSRRACLSVCLFVCPSVPALAASASV